MALPATLNPNTPAGSDSPSQGDDEFRALKQYLIDVFGLPNNSAITASAMSISNSGVVTFTQSGLGFPTNIAGPASAMLQINAQYSNLNIQVAGTSILSAVATGVVMKQPQLEWVSGLTGTLGTQGPQPLVLKTQGVPRWIVDPSGMLFPAQDAAQDLGIVGARPRDLRISRSLTTGTGLFFGGPAIFSGALSVASGFLTLFPAETQGDFLYRAAAGWNRFPAGTSGFLMQSQGSGADPVWITSAFASVTQNTNPVNWTGGHSWAAQTFFLSNVTGKFGFGTSLPTALMHVHGSVYVNSSIYMVGQLVAGAAANAVTTPTGLLDATKITAGIGEVRGDILTRQTFGWARLAPGNSGQFFQTQGSGADPIYTSVPAAALTKYDAVAVPTGFGNNNTTERVLYASSMPANTLTTTGKIRIHADLTLSNNSTSDGGLYLRLRYGTNALFSPALATSGNDGGCPPIAQAIGLNNPVIWKMEIDGAGSTLSQRGFATLTRPGIPNTSVTSAYLTMATPSFSTNAAAQQTIMLSAQWVSALSSATIVLQKIYIEVLS